ncbi:MAG: PP2C family serine/threonine-protein phosphatase [Alphaproteobacteria bacterium]
MVWIVGGDSVQGSMHRFAGTPCQDANQYKVQGDTLFACVADGAGTAQLSQIGSHFVTETFIQLCTEKWGDAVDSPELATAKLRALMQELQDRLLGHAHHIQIPLKNIETTFLGCVVTPDYAVAAQVGDGFLVAKTEGDFDLMLWEDHKEFINETHFITEENYDLRLAVVQGPRFLALGTDGISGLSIDARLKQGFKGFFSSFEEYLLTRPSQEKIHQELKNFLSSDRVNAKTEDDKTLLIAQWV